MRGLRRSSVSAIRRRHSKRYPRAVAQALATTAITAGLFGHSNNADTGACEPGAVPRAIYCWSLGPRLHARMPFSLIAQPFGSAHLCQENANATIQ